MRCVKLSFLFLSACALGALSAESGAQPKKLDLVGTVSFDVGSRTGRVENIAVTIGDGGIGPYKAILAGDDTLPTHAIYRPRDLGKFGGKKLLPVVAFGNGGCRNSSGEFRNFLSEVASHGYVVVAVGPAGDAVVAGSEGPTGITKASQLIDGLNWAEKENQRPESEYYHKLDTSAFAVMGQSCGTAQASQVSDDPRVKSIVLLNAAGAFKRPPAAPAQAANPPPNPTPAAAPKAPGEYGQTGTTSRNMTVTLNRMAQRYAPYAPDSSQPMGQAIPENRPVSYHSPIAYITGGPTDIGHAGAIEAFAEAKDVPTLFAFQNVGHYPATYRKPHGGAFAEIVTAWFDWTLKDNSDARKAFAGSDCKLCKDDAWHIQFKDVTH